MMKLINDLWFTRRDLVSTGFDSALEYISKEIPLKIYCIPSGTKCWTWTVPEKWSVRTAFIEDSKGKRLLDLQEHPLHIVSYSLPIDKIVTKKELLRHLFTLPKKPNAVPFGFRYYEKDWGFCLQHKRLKQFTDNKYRVFIDSCFEKGELKVGECIIKGTTDRTIVLVAHLCHPAMANDDLTGVTVLVEIAKELAKKSNYYTFRLLIVPETIGSIAYLSTNEELIPKICGGIFLEMLGNDNIHALQLSKQGNAKIDDIARYVMKRKLKKFRVDSFLKVVGNDERVFNAPGIEIPMVSISRFPYPEYHTSDDNPKIVSEERLLESKNLVLGILDIFDKDFVPTAKFKGPVFLSGYGLWVDKSKNEKLNKSIEQIMLSLDGTKSVFEISKEIGMDFQDVLNLVNKFYEKGLIA